MFKDYLKIVGVAVILSVVSVGFCVTSHAEEVAPDPEIQALSNTDVVALTTSAIRLRRQYIVASAMNLTEAEGAAFWPVYGEYWEEMGALRDEMGKLVENFIAKQNSLTEDEAAQLVRQYLSLRAGEVEIKQKYLRDFARALPYKKVIRYYQVENKLDTILSYELAKQVPLVETV